MGKIQDAEMGNCKIEINEKKRGNDPRYRNR